MIKRPCSRCGVPSRSNPCPRCKASAPRRPSRPKASRQSRGYNAEYDRNRKLIVDHVMTHGGYCVICRNPIAAGQTITAEHLVPLRQGGTNDLSNLAPAHLRCNSSWRKRR